MTVSVPDDLWASVRSEGDSPSRLVQEGLRLLAEQRATSKLGLLRGGSEAVVNGGKAGARSSEVANAVARLVSEASVLTRAGYEVGIDVAAVLRWRVLEVLPEAPDALVDALRAVATDEAEEPGSAELVAAVRDAVARAEADIEGVAGRDALESPSFLAGMSRAIREVRSAVRQRLIEEAQTSRDEAS